MRFATRELSKPVSAGPITAFPTRTFTAHGRGAHGARAASDKHVALLINHSNEEALPQSRTQLAQRIASVTFAALALIALLPLLVIVAILIKLTSRGPIFYMQARVGLDRRRNPESDAGHIYDRRMRNLGGRAFMIYKFRSMTVDAENRSGAVWATQSDARVTKIGRILRKTRIDELPQLINVLKGDMNIVGPRPERPSIFSRLSEQITEYPSRQRARPGITGLAQINQSYDACLDDVRRKVRFDLEYLERSSLLEDLRIMALTIPVMVFRRGGW